jgi:hypothetical protein
VGVPDFAALNPGYMSPPSIKIEFRAEHRGPDEGGYAERKRDNGESHGFDHDTLPFILSGNPRLMGSSMPKPRGGLCDGHHTPVDSDAAPVAGSRGFPLPRPGVSIELDR